MRGETSPHAGSGGSPTQVSARGGVGPVPAARCPGDDAQQRSDWELEPCVKPWLQLLPAPRVHADFAAASALAVTNEQRSPSLIEVGFSERERFLDAQAGTPQDYDQASQPLPMRAVAGCAHHGDDLLDCGRIGRVAQALVAWWTPRVEPRQRRRRTTSTGTIEQRLGHDPSSGSRTRARALRSVTKAEARAPHCGVLDVPLSGSRRAGCRADRPGTARRP